MRTLLLIAALLTAGSAWAETPDGGDLRPLPPRVERVLGELAITDTQRNAVRELLHARRAARARQAAADREVGRAALRRIVNPDQAVAIEAALPPPGGPRDGTGPGCPPRRQPS